MRSAPAAQTHAISTGHDNRRGENARPFTDGIDEPASAGRRESRLEAILSVMRADGVSNAGVVTFATQSAGCEHAGDLKAPLLMFHGTDDTILYGSCFDANGGLFETLLTAEDAVISDELNHASITSRELEAHCSSSTARPEGGNAT